MKTWQWKSPLLLSSLVSFLVFLAGCDTPWAAAKRQSDGITWEEWRMGIRSKEEKEAREKKVLEKRLEERRAYITNNPNLSGKVANAIIEDRLERGMSEYEVSMVWALLPTGVNTTTGIGGTRKQCVYYVNKLSELERIKILDTMKNSGGDAFAQTYYLYFQNGFLDSWQTLR